MHKRMPSSGYTLEREEQKIHIRVQYRTVSIILVIFRSPQQERENTFGNSKSNF